ncbi:hypothetical protein SF123566_10412 [Shigella flexneri 1235-66]|nr:hypothetical protein SF123566_10412 [Shigella flexneri 1235-66]
MSFLLPWCKYSIAHFAGCAVLIRPTGLKNPGVGPVSIAPPGNVTGYYLGSVPNHFL